MWIIDEQTDREMAALTRTLCDPDADPTTKRAASRRHRQLCRQHVHVEHRKWVARDADAPPPRTRWAGGEQATTRNEAIAARVAEVGGTITTAQLGDLLGGDRRTAGFRARELAEVGVIEFAGVTTNKRGRRINLYRMAQAEALAST